NTLGNYFSNIAIQQLPEEGNTRRPTKKVHPFSRVTGAGYTTQNNPTLFQDHQILIFITEQGASPLQILHIFQRTRLN
ncbi:MAG: hypothetical protein KC643_19960, partial [Nitrospira sp.]|nr:hypothetical protein [Nitrospira sp.]